METREALLSRRSIRRYKPDPITDADLQEILEAGMAAPSAINLQHWYSVVVQSIKNVLLAAWDKGIGSCWMTAPQRVGFGPAFQARFAPDKGEFVAAVTLGYPAQQPKMPPRRDGRYKIV